MAIETEQKVTSLLSRDTEVAWNVMKLRRETMPSDLAILSAEQYGGPAFTRKTAKAKDSPSEQTDDGPRKKAKTTSENVVTETTEDGEETAKRSRGRPRLETKDQTSADVGYVCFTLCYCSACHSINIACGVRGYTTATLICFPLPIVPDICIVTLFP